MDGLKGKRTAAPVMPPRRASGLVLHENMKKKDDKTVPTCSRVSCSSRISSNKGLSIDHKPKSTVRSPSNGKETVGSSSSRATSGLPKTPKVTTRRQLSSLLDTDSSESSSSSVHERRGKTKESSVIREVVTEPGSSSRGSSGNGVQSARVGVNRNGLKDLRSSVLPSSPNPTRKISTFRKKPSDGESSSSSRGYNNNKPEVKNNQSSLPHGNNGIITMSESRRNRNSPSVRDNNSVVSGSSTRRSSTGRTTGRASGAVTALQAPPQPATRAGLINPSRSNAEVSRSPLHSYSRPISSNNGRLRSLMMMPGGSPSRSLMSRDGFRRYDVSGVAEVLLALERMEQDEELTYEEEYVDGDEVGTLPCQHMYHVSCAQQWLRMKNWCPICKTSAESQPQPFS
ncbi:hypothetical protein IGI04_024353 [Brassica rapa subsp. trilocularis]|uniref:RING-type E3 ubiquitin transferase n=1 Tax=Brassica rapa subsp. trilocularis TaxID=1813537 RepID=A0ABQ7M8Z5_BRACM|nr:hypothetical protein IGI04_024353 [Brassica rapa subsp. trilocularis]